MAGRGITNADVRQARDALIARGEYVSIDAVREELGDTGSKTTIHRHLKELREEARHGPRIGDDSVTSEAVQRFADSLARQLHAEANDIVERERTEFAAQAEALTAERDRLVERLAAVENGLSTTKEALEQAQQRIEATGKALAAARTECSEKAARIDGLERRLEEKDERVQSLEERHREDRDALEHFLASAETARKQEEQRHEDRVRAMQADLEESRQVVVLKQDEITRLNGANGELAARLGDAQQETRELKTELEGGRATRLELERDLAKAEERFQQQAQALEALSAQHEKMRAANDSFQRSLEKQVRALGKSEKKQVGLQAKLAAQEAILAELTSKIRTSTNENESDR